MGRAPDPSSAIDYRELDVVKTKAAIWADGHIYPSGSRGTIVHVHRGGEAYEVEFDSPASAVVTLEASDLGAVHWRG